MYGDNLLASDIVLDAVCARYGTVTLDFSLMADDA